MEVDSAYGNNTTGPAPLDLLEALWLAGEMDGLTLVWREGMEDYLPVSQVRIRLACCAHIIWWSHVSSCFPNQVASLREYFQALDGSEEDEVEAEAQDELSARVVAQESGEGRGGSGMTGRQLWELQVLSFLRLL